ncbi:oxidoreductase [Spirosoma utsteinense]|uniref:NAD(P)-dependent dehydrogenase (Short-subunit alcohol dehydrogenase family) n=1 Tax=Spirosoma utsteinense TaxID=2585773 RepID=A0ABR6WDP4_9BACT|nr:oxidoreductase [Spirosoma utsteinense]MBC3788690.1 NAD(P)-dependent dehydrogenase (short-subunit alcohol dehydrogenase family) [Spirosoma utsteinense]MBC3794618.1 NAD(P)-dependent dehydrogenase (short-subunit alcohol dehydrogenase family) [Spirosoma utsteinense]
MDTKKIWFITGASKGFGLLLVSQLLRQGNRVAATSRTIDDLRKAVDNDSDDFLPLAVDLTSEGSVDDAIQATINQFGRIDVVVNNAGYGQLGTLEELTDKEARTNFDVNVFGSLNVIRAVMPHLRKQQSGHVLNLSSVAGISGDFPGWGVYCATKFAVEGFSESLAAEVAPFGIKVTLIEPGYFRTDFLTGGSLSVPKQKIDAYEAVRESEAMHQEQINGNQPGDPQKAVEVMIQIVDEPNPPLHLFLGEDAYTMAHAKIKAMAQDLETWKSLTLSTGFAVAETAA